MKKLLIGLMFVLDVVFLPWLLSQSSAQAADLANNLPIYQQQDALTNFLYQRMVQRETDFRCVYQADRDEMEFDHPAELFEMIWERDASGSDDFDYLLYNVKDYALQIEKQSAQTILAFHIAYRESAQQLAQVNLAVKKALARLQLQGNSDAQKVRKVHDFIIQKVRYDAGTLKDSAYDAIVKHQAASRGYALLAYKMLTDAGVPCRIVHGKVAGTDHFWNMVKLGDVWYYIDVAKDDGDHAVVPVRYTYFLVGKKILERDHQLAEAYQMAEFEENYPVNYQDFKGRDQLILEADAEKMKEKSGVGPFNEIYDKVATGTVDPVEKFNDALSDSLLNILDPVFAGV